MISHVLSCSALAAAFLFLRFIPSALRSSSPARGPCFARIAWAPAGGPGPAFRAGAVRAPDCPRARGRRWTYFSPPFLRAFFRAVAKARKRRRGCRLSQSHCSILSYMSNFLRESYHVFRTNHVFRPGAGCRCLSGYGPCDQVGPSSTSTMTAPLLWVRPTKARPGVMPLGELRLVPVQMHVVRARTAATGPNPYRITHLNRAHKGVVHPRCATGRPEGQKEVRPDSRW